MTPPRPIASPAPPDPGPEEVSVVRRIKRTFVGGALGLAAVIVGTLGAGFATLKAFVSEAKAAGAQEAVRAAERADGAHQKASAVEHELRRHIDEEAFRTGQQLQRDSLLETRLREVQLDVRAASEQLQTGYKPARLERPPAPLRIDGGGR